MLTLVDRDYEMDPENEILVENGRQLQNGMVVLIAKPESRWDVRRLGDFAQREVRAALVMNRWAEISGVRYSGDLVFFTATYPDGSTKDRSVGISTQWLVKIESIVKIAAHDHLS